MLISAMLYTTANALFSYSSTIEELFIISIICNLVRSKKIMLHHMNMNALKCWAPQDFLVMYSLFAVNFLSLSLLHYYALHSIAPISLRIDYAYHTIPYVRVPEKSPLTLILNKYCLDFDSFIQSQILIKSSHGNQHYYFCCCCCCRTMGVLISNENLHELYFVLLELHHYDDCY